jgi:hypothetical protein
MTSSPHTDIEYAYFCVNGYGDYTLITERIGLEPSEAWNAGEPRRRVPGNYPCTKWIYKSGLKDTHPMTVHIEALLDALDQRAQEIRSLAPDYDLIIVCVGEYPSSQHGFHLTKSMIQRAAYLGIEFDFDMYFVSNEEHIS